MVSECPHDGWGPPPQGAHMAPQGGPKPSVGAAWSPSTPFAALRGRPSALTAHRPAGADTSNPPPVNVSGPDVDVCTSPAHTCERPARRRGWWAVDDDRSDRPESPSTTPPFGAVTVQPDPCNGPQPLAGGRFVTPTMIYTNRPLSGAHTPFCAEVSAGIASKTPGVGRPPHEHA